MLVFPPMSSRTTTVQVLKAPKTSSSVRKIFLPRTVAEMLIRWKEQQMETIEALGDEYQDFDLVIASPLGMPTEAPSMLPSALLLRRMIFRKSYSTVSVIPALPIS